MQILQHGFGAVVDVEFAEDMFEVIMNRPRTDAERVGDFLVKLSPAQVLEDFILARGERGEVRLLAGVGLGAEAGAEIIERIGGGQYRRERFKYLRRQAAFENISATRITD